MSHAGESSTYAIVARERQKSMVLRAWILIGIFFMALPGTLLGFSNLMAISTHHGLGSLPAAWLQGHGHAQVFGWIGSFILGIGFYSQPTHGRSVLRIPLTCFSLWTIGVALRWLANLYAWHWRILFPVSAGFELIAVFLFLSAASHHKLPSKTIMRSQAWNSGWSPSYWERRDLPLLSSLILSSAYGWHSKDPCFAFLTRSIRSTLYCWPGDFLCRSCGAFQLGGCLHSLRSPNPTP